MPPRNPLEIPGILALIGAQITLFECRPHFFEGYFFRPKDLLSCCLVSYFWHRTLLPVLWRCYNEDEMSWVPRSVLDQYSQYYVYYQDVMITCAKTVLPCRNLRIMTLHVDPQLNKQQESGQSSVSPFGLVDSNPGLTSLTLFGTWRMSATLTSFDISHCSNLCKLWLCSFQSQPQDFGRLFVPEVTKRLTHLSLVSIHGRCDPSFLRTVCFPSMVQLYIDIGDAIQPGLEELVAFCPRLERLIVRAHTRCRLDRLTKLLQENRIRLKSLHLLSSWIQDSKIDETNNDPNDDNATSAPEDYGVTELIRNCDGLCELTINASNLGIAQAVVRHHRATLEQFSVTVVATEEDLINYSEEEYNHGQARAAAQRASFLIELLTCFPRLKILKFWDTKNMIDGASMIALLTAQPWESNSLESLELSEALGFAPAPAHRSFRVDENHLWEVRERQTQSRMINDPLEATLLAHLFQHVSLTSRAPRLKEILLGSARYIKTQYTDPVCTLHRLFQRSFESLLF